MLSKINAVENNVNKKFLTLGNISDREIGSMAKACEARTHSVPGFFMRASEQNNALPFALPGLNGCGALNEESQVHALVFAKMPKRNQRTKCLRN
jgi:hypothetical protein